MKTDPPDKSGLLDHPLANIYSDGYGLGYLFIFGFWTGHEYYVFSRVVTRPARPTKYTYYYTKLPDPLSLSFSFLLCYSVIAHRPLTLSFSLLHSQPSPSLSSSSFFIVKLLARAHGSFFTGTVKLSLLSLDVCLGKNSPSWGGSRSGETSSELVRQDLIGSDEISLDLAISLPIR